MRTQDETLPVPEVARTGWRPAAWLLLVLPVAILAAMVVLFLTKGESLIGRPPIPPDALLKI